MSLGSTPVAPAAQVIVDMTVVIVGTFETETVARLAASLRRRGFAVVALENVSLIGLLLLTKRVLALVVFEAQLPKHWDSLREELLEISPRTPIVFVSEQDSRNAEQVACDIVSAHEE